MKRLKKHLALLAAAALALTLLAGCTVRPGPDGNIIIVPEDDDYIPAPPVVEAIPENVGEIDGTSISGPKSYQETTYSQIYAAARAELEGKRYYAVLEGKFGDGDDEGLILGKYEEQYYVCMKAGLDQSEIIQIDGIFYSKNGDTWEPYEESIPLDEIKSMVVPDMSNEGTKWFSAETTEGYTVDYTVQDQNKTLIYCWNNKLARIEYRAEETVVGGMIFRTQTTLPDSIENLLKNPPIPPETPAPVN